MIKLSEAALSGMERNNIYIGSTIFVEGEVKNFETARNPGSFSKDEYYRLQGISYELTDVNIIKQSKDYSRYREFLFELTFYYYI